MTESINRKVARRFSRAVENNNFTSTGSIAGQAVFYDSTSDLPTSNIANGSQGYVISTQRLYIRGTGGWYNIATINNTPTINSVQTAAGDSSPFALAIDGSTTTVITILATDSEGFPITFSAVSDVGFDSIATVSQDSSIFTITPLSIDSAGVATSGTLTFKASDGVNIASEVATFTLTFQIENSNFTTLLMKASGNNGTNTTINDASSNDHTVSVNGNAVAQSFTPYHPGGYSAYFDGTGDYLTVAQSDDFTLSGEFTVEMWVYLDQTSYARTIQRLVTSANTGYSAEPYISIGNDTGGVNAGCLCFTSSVGAGNPQGYATIEGTGATGTNLYFPFKQWVHVALTRDSSNVCRLFQDGNIVATVTISGGFDFNGAGNNGLSIAKSGWATTEYFGPGYIKDFRIVKGTSVYTADFTPPTTALTAIPNTKLIACSLPYFDDGSENHAVTVYGDTKTKRFGPYNYSPYNTSSDGASVYFDGSGDFLSIPDTATTEFGSGDFTLEMWYNGADTDQYATLTAKGAGSFSSGNWSLMMNHSVTGDIALYVADYSTGGPMLITGDVGIDNQWNHIAVVRNGNNWNLYVNGVSRASRTSSITIADTTSGVYIGKDQYYGRDLSGFISDYRIVKGTAVYTGNFTPPTGPLTTTGGTYPNNTNRTDPAASATSYLTCNDTANIFNAAGSSNEITLVGNTKSSTAQKKNASASMLFDGSGDAITIGDDINLDFGSGPFTWEGWYRADDVSGDRYIISMSGGTFSAVPTHVGVNFYNGGWRAGGFNDKYAVGTTGIETNVWHHFALCHNNRQLQFYIDGTQVGNTIDVTSDTFDCGGNFRIGSFHSNTGSGNWDGYLEDIRISKGLSRYPFIPFSTTLSASDVSGTQLLACHAASATTEGTGGLTINTTSSPTVTDFGPHPGMKSISFDGTDDNLYIADGTYKTFGTGNYTIECWWYPEEASQGTYGDYIWGDGSSGQNLSGSNQLMYTTDDKLKWYSNYGGGATPGPKTTFTITPYKWYHIACQRNGNVFEMYVNGSLATSLDAGSAVTVNDSTGAWTIGDYGVDYSPATSPVKCKISNFRIVKGTAVYSNSFTPPTAELTA